MTDLSSVSLSGDPSNGLPAAVRARCVEAGRDALMRHHHELFLAAQRAVGVEPMPFDRLSDRSRRLKHQQMDPLADAAVDAVIPLLAEHYEAQIERLRAEVQHEVRIRLAELQELWRAVHDRQDAPDGWLISRDELICAVQDMHRPGDCDGDAARAEAVALRERIESLSGELGASIDKLATAFTISGSIQMAMPANGPAVIGISPSMTDRERQAMDVCCELMAGMEKLTDALSEGGSDAGGGSGE